MSERARENNAHLADGLARRVDPFEERPDVKTLKPIAVLALLGAVLVLPGCGGRWRLGPAQTRRDVYMNLMTPLQQAEYRHMEAAGKPLSLRLAYLQGIGVYQTWAEQPKEIQEAVLRREVREGMTPVQVQMAWGHPAEKRDGTLPAERAGGHSRTLWEYEIRSQGIGGSHYERSVCFYDGRVLWVRDTG